MDTFFELDYSQVTDNFLQKTTLNDLWEKIVGNKAVSDKLLPSIFKDDSFTFFEFINNINQYEKKFNSNVQKSFGLIEQQIDNERSHFILDIDLEKGTKREFYWVHNTIFAVFDGITAD